LTLPTPLDSSKVQAELENGILTVVVPKAEEAKPRTIKVTQK
jgi:HSP20 family protein